MERRSAMDVFVARQPIFDCNMEVFGYELLYRSSEENFFDRSIASNVATSILLMNSYFTFGINNLIGTKKAFINFDRNLVEAEIPHILDKKIVIIELLEDIVPDEILLNRIKNLKENNYIIALDDFVEKKDYDELILLCDIIKVDFLCNSKDEIKRICYKWKKRGKKLLAEKVETNEEFLWAKEIGFDLFQGYFFCKPMIVKSKKLETNPMQYIKIIEELSRKEPDYKIIANVIEKDVALTYKLLRLVNSKFSHDVNIDTIQHAISILGIIAMEKWISLIMVQDLGQEKPSELVKVALLRTKFGEQLALSSEFKKDAQKIMLIEILSVLDVILEKSMEEVVKMLPLSEEIKDTLLGKVTKYSDLYKLILHYERGEWDSIDEDIEKSQIDVNKLPQMYCNAVKWAEDLYNYMNSEMKEDLKE